MQQMETNEIQITDSVAWTKSELVGMTWLHLAGERGHVFHLLGRLAADRMHAVMAQMPERKPLSQWFASKKGESAYAQLVAKSLRADARGMLELQEMAAGADIDFNELLEANFRGDVGVPDGTGCSDLAFCDGQSSFCAHNEDGAPDLRGKMLILTLSLEGEPSVTVQWYPGFLPCNSHVATSAGLVWGINHIQVTNPPQAEGRHFVARAVQSARALEDAAALLNNAVTAGGFSYNIGEVGTGRIVSAEVAGGTSCVRNIEKNELLWHTNHLLNLPSRIDSSPTGSDASDALGLRSESLDRGRYLSSLSKPSNGQNTADWYLNILSAQSLPNGVRRFALGNDPLMTLITSVCDLKNKTISLKSYDDYTAVLPFDSYVKTAERTAMEQRLQSIRTSSDAVTL
jgi:hypothetical protein